MDISATRGLDGLNDGFDGVENTRHISTASNDLAGLANEMMGVVSQFKV